RISEICSGVLDFTTTSGRNFKSAVSSEEYLSRDSLSNKTNSFPTIFWKEEIWLWLILVNIIYCIFTLYFTNVLILRITYEFELQITKFVFTTVASTFFLYYSFQII